MTPTVSGPVRVLIADDHPVFRDGLASLLGTQPDVTVVATAADGVEAVALAAEHQPDVVVMDLQMPEMNGIDATRRLAETQPDVRVLVFTMGEEDGTVLAAMRAGARGYLVKGASQEEVARAISTVHAGGLVFGASLALRIADLLSGSATPDRSAFPQLTEREVEILDLIAAGRNNSQIASALYLAPKTVRNNVSNILAKLQATDRAEAIIRARDAGLGGT
ncbi:LuxR family transcriptional regulator [Nocardioides sp. Root1257]|uniref:response regulator n=1 Tax=unclassified Nocardioides TaxID=2615069 RepID=UPI0006FB9C6B|nr:MULTISPECIES: response regulator transcription factor [unclassified Nocardioides]KQW53160.1 LuxR family transcriptional regulator [Nocardioides sp. Root1257]KRC55847.1 LuxR family transcriptional regulator [Nocardioides sp. Root224]